MDDAPTSASNAILELRNVEKDYRGLRPLRIRHLRLSPGESLALLGFDQITAELFVNLATGAVTPDAGEVFAFGQSTSNIADADAWLASLDRFGILTDRTVLLEELTVEQNLALAYTLELDSISDAARQLVSSLGEELGLTAVLSSRAATVSQFTKSLLRLGRAIALNPELLLAEHPNALLATETQRQFAEILSKAVSARRMAAVVLTADSGFASAVASRVETLQPATGALRRTGRVRRWWSRV